MKKNKILKIIVIGLFLTGCSSWELKNRCEKTNWFEYGQGVAFNGQYLEEDAFVKDCKGVDRVSARQVDLGFKLGREKMCNYDELFNRGRTGVPVFFKFCDGLDPAKMNSHYSKGLKLFCTSENGQPYGRSGKVYQNVCPAPLEKNFLPPYYLGRKEYLKQYIVDLNAKIVAQAERESSLIQSESTLSREISYLPSPQVCKIISVYNEAIKKDESKTVCSEADYIRRQRDRLYSDISNVRSSLYEVRRDLNQYTQDLNTARSELTKIPIVDELKTMTTQGVKATGG